MKECRRSSRSVCRLLRRNIRWCRMSRLDGEWVPGSRDRLLIFFGCRTNWNWKDKVRSFAFGVAHSLPPCSAEIPRGTCSRCQVFNIGDDLVGRDQGVLSAICKVWSRTGGLLGGPRWYVLCRSRLTVADIPSFVVHNMKRLDGYWTHDYSIVE
jgi:hypothetical protein